MIGLMCAGCSTAPLADLLDAVDPGGSGYTRDVEAAPAPLPPARLMPSPQPPNRNDPPPLPPVPSSFNPDDEGRPPPAARLQPTPAK